MSFLGWYYDDAPRASSSPFAQTDCQIQEGIQEGQTWICTNVGPYLLIQMDFKNYMHVCIQPMAEENKLFCCLRIQNHAAYPSATLADE